MGSEFPSYTRVSGATTHVKSQSWGNLRLEGPHMHFHYCFQIVPPLGSVLRKRQCGVGVSELAEKSRQKYSCSLIATRQR